MYALKRMTVTVDGRQVEEVRVLGDMYRLEVYPPDSPIVAQIEYSHGANMPCIQVERTDKAYITTIAGDTVRAISRGDAKARQEKAKRLMAR